MLTRIHELEMTARSLEPGRQERQALRSQVMGYAEEFLGAIDDLPAFSGAGDKGIDLYESPIGEEPSDMSALIDLIRRHVDTPGLNPASAGHLGYIPGGGIYASALGDYLADVTNRYAGVFYASPGAVRMENMLLAWMARMVGYSAASAGGNLTSGGSIANLAGIVAARDAAGITSAEIPRSVIYLTSQAHHSVDKAIRIAGLGECVLRSVPTDDRHRMDIGSLKSMIAGDKKAGLRPFLVIAAAGTTDTGAVDPLDAIGDLARAHGLWFHCDAAYGGFFALCDEGRKILKGLEKADSIVVDPHKGLFLPYGTGALLVRDTKHLFDAFRYQANYLLDARQSVEELSPADLSPELSKHFRGLRLWLPLKLHGVKPFRAALEEKLLLARYFHEKIRHMDGFEAGCSPDLSVVTYRYVPKRGEADAFNQRLIQAVQRDGRVFLSSTRLRGAFVLRLAVLAFRTHLQTIDFTLDLLKEKARQIALEE